MATGDKLVNLDGLKAVYDDVHGDVSDLKSAVNPLPTGKADIIVSSASGAVANFPDGAGNLPVEDLVIGIEPVQAGSGDPSPDNVRPIAGWTGVNVTRTGKNLIPNIKSGITANVVMLGQTNSYTVSQDIFLNPGTYTIKVKTQVSCYLFYRGHDGTNNRTESIVANPSYTFTLTEPEYVAIWAYTNNGITASDIESFQLELCSTASDYEAYSGATYPISWQSTAGAVYGGSLDVTTGVLTVTHAQIASYAGETLPGEWISDRDVYASGTTPSTGAQVVYALATPVTYQLTPQEVKTLLGWNNIFADTGNTSVFYRADTKLYIDNKITQAIATLNA